MLIDTSIRFVEWLIRQLKRLDFYLLVSRLPPEERARFVVMLRAMVERQGKEA